jgi:hypothetical protein
VGRIILVVRLSLNFLETMVKGWGARAKYAHSEAFQNREPMREVC